MVKFQSYPAQFEMQLEFMSGTKMSVVTFLGAFSSMRTVLFILKKGAAKPKTVMALALSCRHAPKGKNPQKSIVAPIRVSIETLILI